jgi:hypothetical protein
MYIAFSARRVRAIRFVSPSVRLVENAKGNVEMYMRQSSQTGHPLRWSLVALCISFTLLTSAVLRFQVDAAGSFAAPAFEKQWQAGEAIVPNFLTCLPNSGPS